ncbi:MULTISPECIES: hypothetical protein [unclassified Adlercreutzia]|uniref:hypothetical protein n=1 Tax=unclassified Adlercreutzia TaxID=2636013 RepID=UPI0013E9E696|nr:MULTISPECIES: hypothetical protein [unclassified Adlercreutzia]
MTYENDQLEQNEMTSTSIADEDENTVDENESALEENECTIDESANEEETIELEFDESDIVGYIVDEDDVEIGIIVMEDGEEVEYYYAEEEEPVRVTDIIDEYDLGITREGVASATKDMNVVFKEGAAVASEFKGAYDDIMKAFDFKSLLKK